MFGAARRGHAVARDDEREGVAHAGPADRAGGRGEGRGERAVGKRLPVGDGGDPGAELIAARAGQWREGEGEVLARAGKPFCDLSAGLV